MRMTKQDKQINRLLNAVAQLDENPDGLVNFIETELPKSDSTKQVLDKAKRKELTAKMIDDIEQLRHYMINKYCPDNNGG